MYYNLFPRKIPRVYWCMKYALEVHIMKRKIVPICVHKWLRYFAVPNEKKNWNVGLMLEGFHLFQNQCLMLINHIWYCRSTKSISILIMCSSYNFWIINIMYQYPDHQVSFHWLRNLKACIVIVTQFYAGFDQFYITTE